MRGTAPPPPRPGSSSRVLRSRFLPDLLTLHLEEFQLHWRRWQASLRSPDETLRDVATLEERVAAHRQGLLAVHPSALEAHVAPALAGDEPAAACADEIAVPDADEARRVWARLAGALRGATRLRRGVDVGRPLDAAGAARLDLLGRRELFLRARSHGRWGGVPAQLEPFPQARETR